MDFDRVSAALGPAGAELARLFDAGGRPTSVWTRWARSPLAVAETAFGRVVYFK